MGHQYVIFGSPEPCLHIHAHILVYCHLSAEACEIPIFHVALLIAYDATVVSVPHLTDESG